MATLTREQIEKIYQRQNAKTPAQRAQIMGELRKQGHQIVNEQTGKKMSGLSELPKNGPDTTSDIFNAFSSVASAPVRAARSFLEEVPQAGLGALNAINPLSRDSVMDRLKGLGEGVARTALAPASALTAGAFGQGTSGPNIGDIAQQTPGMFDSVLREAPKVLSEMGQQVGQGAGKIGNLAKNIGTGAMDLVSSNASLLSGDVEGFRRGQERLRQNELIQNPIGSAWDLAEGLSQGTVGALAAPVITRSPELQRGMETMDKIFTFLPTEGAKALGFDTNTAEGRAVIDALSVIQEAGIGLASMGASSGLRSARKSNIGRGIESTIVNKAKDIDDMISSFKTSPKGTKVEDILNTMSENLSYSKNHAKTFINNLSDKAKPLADRLIKTESIADDMMSGSKTIPTESISRRLGLHEDAVNTIQDIYSNPETRNIARDIYNTALETENNPMYKTTSTDILAREALEPAYAAQSLRDQASLDIRNRMRELRNNVVPTESIKKMSDSVSNMVTKFGAKIQNGKIIFKDSRIDSSPKLKSLLKSLYEKVQEYADVPEEVSAGGGLVSIPNRNIKPLRVGQLDNWRKDLFELQDAINQETIKGVPKKLRTSLQEARAIFMDAIGDAELSDASRRFAVSDDVLQRFYDLGRDKNRIGSIDDLTTNIGVVLKRITGENVGAGTVQRNLSSIQDSLEKLGISYNIENIKKLTQFNEFIKKDLFPPLKRGSFSGEVYSSTRASDLLNARKLSEQVDYALGSTLGKGIQKTLDKVAGVAPGAKAIRELLEKMGSDIEKPNYSSWNQGGMQGEGWTASAPETSTGTPYSREPIVEVDEKMMASLSPENQALYQASIDLVNSNPEKIVNEYKARFGANINADNAKELFRPLGYNGSNAAAVHEASSAIAKRVFDDYLEELSGEEVVFTAGGAGSGKGTAISNVIGDIESAGIVYDSVLKSADGAKNLINKVKESGNTPTIIYVYRDPYDAFMNGVVKRMLGDKEPGRIVPLTVFTEGHKGALATAKTIGKEKYANIRVVDNSLGAGKQKAVPLSALSSKSVDWPDTRKRIVQELDRLYEQGVITEDQRSALLQ